MNPNPFQNYKQVSIQTASPEKLILMLYDGIIRFGNQAKQAMVVNDIKQTNHLLNRMHDILNELMATLDMNNGGEIASNLYRIYEYSNHRLLESNIKRNPEIIEEVIKLISEIREGWSQAMTRMRQEV